MFIVGLLTWWYGAGWQQRVLVVRERLVSTFDYFSIDLLLRTLFSPFRQISAGSVQGPIGVQLQAWFDQLISRVIGSFVRTLTIFIGIITLAFVVVFGVVSIVTWALVPLLPAVGIVMAMIGWLPWTI